MYLQEWANKNEPKKEMFWYQSFWDQIIFIRDKIGCLAAHDEDSYKKAIIVVSTHRSKSIDLPVYEVVVDNTVTVQMRGNFHDWNISVDSKIELNCDFLDCIKDNRNYLFFQGMTKEYSPWKDNKKQFSVYCEDIYELYTFFRVIKKYIKDNKNVCSAS